MSLLEKATIITTPTAQSEGKLHSIKGGSVADFDVVRGSAATRVNAEGLIEDIRVIGDEEVSNGSFSEEGVEEITNGDFSNGSTDWTLGTGWSIGDDKATFDETIGGAGNLNQSNILTVGKTYKLTFDTLETNGGNLAYAFGNNSVFINNIQADTTHVVYGVADDVFLKIRGASNFNGSITNISVKEVGQNWALGTGWSIGEDEANCDGTQTSNSSLSQNSALPNASGKTYKISFTVSNYISGSVQVYPTNTTVGTYIKETANGTYTRYVKVTSLTPNDILYIQADSNFIGSITNISVVEIIDATNIPRIDYSTGEGVILTEPQSTNLVTYSEDFSDSSWFKGNTSVIANQELSPSGIQDADKVTFLAVPNANIQLTSAIATTIGEDYTYSIYAKADTNVNNVKFGGGIGGDVDLAITDSWQRFSVTFTATSTTTVTTLVTRDATLSNIYLWGAQLEEQSYSTSYIPTSGAIATRLADEVTGAGSTDLINSTEGVLYAEIAALANDETNRVISLNSGQRSNSVRLYFDSSGLGEVTMQVRSGNVLQVIEKYVLSNLLDFNKIAIKYKENDFALWVNGIEVDTDTSGITPIGLDTLSFNDGSLDDFHGKTKTIAVFSEALTDEELTCLTTI